ncbi:TLC domain-containing protein 3A-like [Mytilus edulis]|uniref:TLC domain-containing protein 3A-like n=1 Tax=Mytilus edulis TaxID=6550 RepID=UPI0039EE5618
MEVAGLTLAGGATFSCTYLLIRRILLSGFSHKISIDILCDLSLKIVSSLQAIASFTIGNIIATACQGNIMTDRHWLTNSYAVFALPYFVYDVVAMYEVHYHQYKEIQKKPLLFGIQHFLRRNKAMMIHHIVLPIIFYPAIILLRKGYGDFFVGVFYQIELAIPFIVFRGALAELNMKDTTLYVISGLLMIVTFAVTRVTVFPYLYWKYSIHANISFWEVPWNIPIKCNVGCLIILVLQVYWLAIMVKGAVRVFYKMYITRISKKSSTE